MNAEDAGGRHRGREVALQVLYAIDLRETGARVAAASRAAKPFDPLLPESELPAVPVDAAPADPIAASGLAFDRVTENFDVPKSASDFARMLVLGVAGRAEVLDELVGQHSRNWRVSRMAAVDRNVLRLGAFELRDTETPVAIVIDEAVDLARRFGSDTSPAFVNGILDAVAKEVRGG